MREQSLSESSKTLRELHERDKELHQIVTGGACIGCGACASMPGSRLRMELSERGHYLPVVKSSVSNHPNELPVSLSHICPFSDRAANEDELSAELFGTAPYQSSGLGRYYACFAGRVRDEAIFNRSSSGGLSRWLLAKLLSHDHVDFVVNVRSYSQGGNLAPYEYAIQSTPEEVLARSSKSAYCPVEMSNVIEQIRSREGRYAITGVPCFAKAIRNLCRHDSNLNDRIKYVLGIVCGHQKSTWYGEMIAWQLGVPPGEKSNVDFRVKIQGAKAKEKGVSASVGNNSLSVAGPKKVGELFGTGYAQGFFKNSACELCDDVTAETADVSFGDAWLPQYLSKGTSLVIVRNHAILRVLQDGIDSGELSLDPLEGVDAERSQAGGLRDRREGLAYRLANRLKEGRWIPKKRVDPNMQIPRKRRRLYELRCRLTEASYHHYRIARDRQDWYEFCSNMQPLVDKYHEVQNGWTFTIRQRVKILLSIFKLR